MTIASFTPATVARGLALTVHGAKLDRATAIEFAGGAQAPIAARTGSASICVTVPAAANSGVFAAIGNAGNRVDAPASPRIVNRPRMYLRVSSAAPLHEAHVVQHYLRCDGIAVAPDIGDRDVQRPARQFQHESLAGAGAFAHAAVDGGRKVARLSDRLVARIAQCEREQPLVGRGALEHCGDVGVRLGRGQLGELLVERARNESRADVEVADEPAQRQRVKGIDT